MEATRFSKRLVTSDVLDASKLNQRLLLPFTEFDLFKPSSQQRQAVENYIADSFYKSYQAKISYFLPNLMTSQNGGVINAALGFQSANNTSLFLEQYLEHRIDDEISDIALQQVSRDKIVEVGNLTSTKQGSTQMMFVFVAAVLYHAGFEWMTFTATKQVSAIIEKLAMPLYPIAKASPDVLLDRGESWGRYYANNPTVVAAYIPDAFEFIKAHKVASFALSQYQNRIADFAKVINK